MAPHLLLHDETEAAEGIIDLTLHLATCPMLIFIVKDDVTAWSELDSLGLP